MNSLTKDTFLSELKLSPYEKMKLNRLQVNSEGCFEEFCVIFNKLIQFNLETIKLNYGHVFVNFDSFETYSFLYLNDFVLNQSIRSLIKEINESKNINNKNRDIYDEFVGKIETISFHQYFFEKYPVLYDVIINRIKNYFNTIRIFINRLLDDFELIKTFFCIKLSKKNMKISKLVMSDGDLHNEGSSTIIFYISNIGIVYKPKDLENDILITEFLNLINREEKQMYKLAHVPTINRKKYGWQLKVNQKSCSSVEEIEKYYYRMGSFLSIFSLFGTDDLHNENVISSSEHPYFIDLETMVKTKTNPHLSNGLMKNFFDEIDKSVLSTMLLPTNAVYSATDIDIGGISSFNEFHSKKLNTFKVKNIGNDKISLVKEAVYGGKGNNHVYLNNELIYPNNYVTEITKGYSDTSTIIKNNIKYIKKMVSNWSLLTRYVARPTFIYGKFLEASTHYNYLENVKKRKSFFELLNLSNNTELDRIVEYEIQSLLNGDIPLFYQKKLDLMCNNKIEIKNFFPVVTPEDNLRHRIEEFCSIDIKRQLDYIKLSLSTLKNKKNKRFNKIIDPIEKNQLDEIGFFQKIENILNDMDKSYFRNLIWDDKRKSCTWVVVSQVDNNNILTASNGIVYENGGLILYYIFRYINTKEKLYLFYAESMFQGLIDMGMIKQNLTESAFTGLGSYLYISFNLYRTTSDQKYLEVCKEIIRRIRENPLTNIDYINGVSGLLVLLKNIYKYFKHEDIIELSKKCFIFLEKNISDFKPEVGLAHGYSGLALGFIAAAELLENRKLVNSAIQMIHIENNHFNHDLNNWLDMRDGESVSFGWCRGSTGIVLARSKLSKYIEMDNYFDIGLQISLDSLNTSELVDDSVCHGFFGIIDSLIEIDKHLSNVNFSFEIEHAIQKRIDLLSINGFEFGTNELLESDSFFLGTSGLNYTLMRILNSKLPCVTLLEIF